MRYVILDTDVASRVIKRQLSDPLAARMAGATWCVTFVTVGELWQWAAMRDWGPRTREELEQWLDRMVILDSDDATSRTWDRISAAAGAEAPEASQRQLDRRVLPGTRVPACDPQRQGLRRLRRQRGTACSPPDNSQRAPRITDRRNQPFMWRCGLGP